MLWSCKLLYDSYKQMFAGPKLHDSIDFLSLFKKTKEKWILETANEAMNACGK